MSIEGEIRLCNSRCLQAAFFVLGSPERRRLYDLGNEAAAKSPKTEATEAEFDPFSCSCCGKISAQLRYVRYYYVLSFLFFSYRRDSSGIFLVPVRSP